MQGLIKILVLLFAISIIPAFGQVDKKIEVGIDEQLGHIFHSMQFLKMLMEMMLF